MPNPNLADLELALLADLDVFGVHCRIALFEFQRQTSTHDADAIHRIYDGFSTNFKDATGGPKLNQGARPSN